MMAVLHCWSNFSVFSSPWHLVTSALLFHEMVSISALPFNWLWSPAAFMGWWTCTWWSPVPQARRQLSMAVQNVALSQTRRSGPSVHHCCTLVSFVNLVCNSTSVSLCFLICNTEGCHSIFLAVGMAELIHTKSGPRGDNHPACRLLAPGAGPHFPHLVPGPRTQPG